MLSNLFKSPMASLFMRQQYRFFSTSSQTRLYADRVTFKYPTDLGRNLLSGPKNITVQRRKMPLRVDKQPIPLNDYINFKVMQSGNEILLNLDNCDNLRNGELVSALIELGRRDAAKEHDWNAHPIVQKALQELKQRLPRMNAKNVIQTPLLLQSLRIVDSGIWQVAARHGMRLLHKYKGREMAFLLDIYDADIPDEEGEPLPVRKCDDDLFERVTGIMPMQIKHLSKENLVRVLEVVVKRGLGSERLYRDYLLLKIERNIIKFSVDQYCRIIRSLADKQYVEDNVFWNEYVFKFMRTNPTDKRKEAKDRTFTDGEARKLWDALIYLKLKCPSLDVKDHIAYVE